jgi:hypothetical protein
VLGRTATIDLAALPLPKYPRFSPLIVPCGGRSWWARPAFTRINITPTISKEKIEDLREAHPLTSVPACDRAVGKWTCGYRRGA